MTRNEFTTLFKRIESEFSNFSADYDEWYRVLSNYSYNDVLNNLKNYRGNTPPIYSTLIRNLKVEEKINDWITCCDICKERITIHNNDMTEYEKHFRKCSKIDFIDRMCVKFRGHHVATAKYYEMSDSELDSAYHKIMNFYLQNKDKDEKEFLKDFPDE
jgi:hypothetical protein